MVIVLKKIVKLMSRASLNHKMLHHSFEKAKWAFEKKTILEAIALDSLLGS